MMINVNGLFEVDTRAFGKYCNQISQSIQRDAGKLGMCMDSVQANAFCKEVNKRAKAK